MFMVSVLSHPPKVRIRIRTGSDRYTGTWTRRGETRRWRPPFYLYFVQVILVTSLSFILPNYLNLWFCLEFLSIRYDEVLLTRLSFSYNYCSYSSILIKENFNRDLGTLSKSLWCRKVWETIHWCNVILDLLSYVRVLQVGVSCHWGREISCTWTCVCSGWIVSKVKQRFIGDDGPYSHTRETKNTVE